MSKLQTCLSDFVTNAISHIIQAILEGGLKVALAPDKALANLTPINYVNSTDTSVFTVPINIIEVYGKNLVLINKKFLDILHSTFPLSSSSIFDKKILLLEVFKTGEFHEDEFAIVACKPYKEPNNMIYKVSIGNKSCIFKNKTIDTLYVPLDKIINLSKKYLDPDKGAVVIQARKVIVELQSNSITFTTEHDKIVALIVLSDKTFECGSLPFANEFVLEPRALLTYENENHELFYAQNLSDRDLSLNIVGLIEISTSFEYC